MKEVPDRGKLHRELMPPNAIWLEETLVEHENSIESYSQLFKEHKKMIHELFVEVDRLKEELSGENISYDLKHKLDSMEQAIKKLTIKKKTTKAKKKSTRKKPQ